MLVCISVYARKKKCLFCSLYMSVTFHIPTFPRGQVSICVFIMHSNMVQQILTYAELLQEQLISCTGLDFEFAHLLELAAFEFQLFLLLG